MEKIANDTLSLWREEGTQRIQENFDVFRSLIAETKDLVQNAQYEAAAINAEMAAYHALFRHCGFFVSQELEHILLTIGQRAIPSSLSSPKKSFLSERPKNILHISTNVSVYSGIPRLIRRWITQDTNRSHSVALTKQTRTEVPKTIQDAVINSQGKIYLLNETIGGLISRAKQLRKIAATADVIVLHTWEFDVVPMIAFANKEQLPPIIYVNHGDHWFWLGAGISDIVANLRESGMRLSQERRDIKPERNMLLPTILEPINREYSRVEAKRQLGIPENTVLLLSIARAAKYKTINGITFADAHVPLLKQYQQAILIVIGPGTQEDWSLAIEQTQGRIKVFPEREDTAIFYQAADIYVDSFPFISNTSLLEAGSYGTPLVSRYPYSDGCSIIGADMPGLTGNLIVVRNTDDYTKVLSNLVKDEEYRLYLGELTRKKIVETHWGHNWQQALENVYIRASTLPRINKTITSPDEMFLGEPDVFLPIIHDGNFNQEWIIQFHLGILPFPQRFKFWIKSLKKYGFRNRFGLLLPEWVISLYYSRLRSFLPF